MLLTKNQRTPIELSPRIAESRYFCVAHQEQSEEFIYFGGYEQSEPNYVLERDSFPFLTLEVVLSGTGTMELGDVTRPFQAGDCFCFGPGLRQRIAASPKERLEKFFMTFGRNAFPRRSHPKELYPGCLYEGVDPDTLRKWSELIIEEGIGSEAGVAENVASLLDVLIRKIAERSPAPAPRKGYDALVARALRKLDREFQTLRSVKELADSLNVSSEHLCRAFQRSHHASPYRILMRNKMAHAYRLLKLSPLTIQEIADSVGFSDAFHFSRAFKKLYGIPPSQAR